MRLRGSVLFTLLLLAAPAGAQSLTGVFTGVVTDASGAVVPEAAVITLRAEAFNALNHTNLNGPNVDLTVTTDQAGNPIFNSPNFGLITSARTARFCQLVARFEF